MADDCDAVEMASRDRKSKDGGVNLGVGGRASSAAFRVNMPSNKKKSQAVGGKRPELEIREQQQRHSKTL